MIQSDVITDSQRTDPPSKLYKVACHMWMLFSVLQRNHFHAYVRLLSEEKV